MLDDRETIHGALDTAVTLPPGEPVIVPLQVRLDLRKFFEGSAETLVNLAAGIAGVPAQPARVALRAIPSISTPLGPLSYPTPITIEYRTTGTTGPL